MYSVYIYGVTFHLTAFLGFALGSTLFCYVHNDSKLFANSGSQVYAALNVAQELKAEGLVRNVAASTHDFNLAVRFSIDLSILHQAPDSLIGLVDKLGRVLNFRWVCIE